MRSRARLHPVLVLCAILALASLSGARCGGSRKPAILIDSPANGSFTTDPVITVSGRVVDTPLGQIVDVTVNGISVPLGGQAFSIDLPMNPGAVFNPIEAVLVLPGKTVRHRITVVAGDGVTSGFVLDGQASPESIGMRISDAGLDQVGPVVEELAGGAFDIGGLITEQNPILDDECVVTGAFGECLYNATANVVEVGLGGFSLDADALGAGSVRSVITIEDFFVEIDLNVRDQVAVEFSCTLEIEAASSTITADFSMEPLAGDPSKVDVSQIGPLQVALGGFQSQFVSGICDDPVLGDIIQLLVTEDMLEGLVSDGFEQNLADPDGAGPLDSPLAAGIETALGGIEVAGPIGEALAVSLDAPFAFISEDADGISFAADATITNVSLPLAGPDLAASWTRVEPFPSFGAVTPQQGLPYGLALAISTSAFNQLLKAQVENGLLQEEVSEIPFLGAQVPLTAGLLSLFIPEFGSADPDDPVVVRLEPVLAPVLTGGPGPGGELAELRIAGLQADLVRQSVLELRLVVDARLGFDLDFVDGALAFDLSAPSASDVDVSVLFNPIGTDEASLLDFLETFLPSVFPSLVGALGSFPLPDFLGLELAPVEVSRAGDLLALYVDLVPAPGPRIENSVVTDLSTGDFRVDSIFDVREWRHRVSGSSSGGRIDANLKGMLGADACCTVEDESASATASYRVAFDVAADPGETWSLDVAHSLLGAFTLFDESNAVGDGGGSVSVGSVSATWSVTGGASGSFDLAPSVSSVTHAIGGGEGDSNVEFSGQNGVLLPGTGPAHVELVFSFGLNAFSNSNAFFPAIGGDEVAIRLGKNDTIQNGFTAGSYPGPGGRNVADDGHRVSVELLTPAP